MRRLLLCIFLELCCLISYGQQNNRGQQLLDKATQDWNSSLTDITSVRYSDIISTTEEAVKELEKTSDSLNLCKSLNLIKDLYSEQLNKSDEIIENYSRIKNLLPDSCEGYATMAKCTMANFLINYRPDYAISLITTIDSFDGLNTTADLIRVGYCLAASYNFTGDYVGASMFYGIINQFEVDILDDNALVWYLIAKGDYALYELSCLGNSSTAFSILVDCVNILDQRKLSKSLAHLTIVRDIGIAYYRSRRYEDAISFLDDIEKSNIYKKLFGNESGSNIIFSQILAETYSGLGQYDKADSLIKNALGILEKESNVNSMFGLALYSTYAHNFSFQKEYEQSSQAHRKSLIIS